jgi:hypothetical protein
MENVTEPLPVPRLLPATDIQFAPPSVVHAHPAGAVTFTSADPPSGGALTEAGLTAYVHCGTATPACTNVKPCPATVSVPVRAFGVGLGSTVYFAVPLPPVLVPETLIQGTPVDDVHAHPAGALTTIEPVPPSEPKAAVVGEIEYSHGVPGGTGPGDGDDPAWVSVTVRPATTIAPVRLSVPEFGPTA